MLEGERKSAMKRICKHRLKEKATARVLVVLDQTANRVCRIHSWVMDIKAEPVVPLFDASMQGAVVATEADREQKIILSTISQKESALTLFVQESFCFITINDTPVE